MRILWIALVICGSPAGAAEPPRYRVDPFLFRGPVEKLVTADLDRDGLQDLVCAADRRIDLYFQRRGGVFALETPDLRLALPGESVGWDLDLARGSEETRVLALVDGKEVRSWSIDAASRQLSAARVELSGVRVFLPRGVRHLHFVRDVNGDGSGDLVLPGAGVLSIYLRQPDRTYARGPEVRSRVELESRLQGEGGLHETIGQSLHIPPLSLRDVNGDGRPDLFSRSDERLDVYLATGGGDFPAEPSFSVDLAAIRERVGSFDPDRLDFSNLTSVANLTIQTEFEDVSGDGIEDLVLREGGKVSLFLGKRNGMDLRRPHQVLKSGGNVLAAVLHDEDDDGERDLWLVRVEAVSIGDIFLWLVASGSLDFEAFLYPWRGDRFARRPARRLVVTLEFPSVLSILEMRGELRERIDRSAQHPMVSASLDGGEEPDDLLLLRDGMLQFYLGAGDGRPIRAESTDLLAVLDYRRDRDRYVVDLEALLEALLPGGSSELSRLRDRTPDLELPIRDAGAGSDLRVLDLNGDRRADVLVLSELTEEGLRGALVLSALKEE